MKFQIANRYLLAGVVAVFSMSQPAIAQVPSIVNADEPNNADAPNNPTTTAAASSLRVSCQNLKTVVQKGDREAVMVKWNYGGFGKEFTPVKRCQIVSERLQQAAITNGGTFKELQLASGTVNAQAVICVLQSNEQQCNRQNLLFTLNPANARNPEAVIQRIFSFAQDGSSSLNESATRPQVDMSLDRWEQKAFGRSSVRRSPVPNSKKANTGF
jgi:Circadian oscillating protein COP23